MVYSSSLLVDPTVQENIGGSQLGTANQDSGKTGHADLTEFETIAKVINHGMSENLLHHLHDTMDVFREFFALPPDDKASFFSEDPNKLCRLITSIGNYDRENVHLWRDALRHPCHPLDKFIPLWPQQLLKYQEHVGKCSTQVRKVALNILELISEELGIEYGHFSDELSQETVLAVNYYPPCPDPCLTLGMTKHCDPNLITILLHRLSVTDHE